MQLCVGRVEVKVAFHETDRKWWDVPHFDGSDSICVAILLSTLSSIVEVQIEGASAGASMRDAREISSKPWTNNIPRPRQAMCMFQIPSNDE